MNKKFLSGLLSSIGVFEAKCKSRCDTHINNKTNIQESLHRGGKAQGTMDPQDTERLIDHPLFDKLYDPSCENGCLLG